MGTRKYSNGNLYEGSFSHGEPNGEGTMRYTSGCAIPVHSYKNELRHVRAAAKIFEELAYRAVDLAADVLGVKAHSVNASKRYRERQLRD